MINIRPGPGPITSWTWDHKMVLLGWLGIWVIKAQYLTMEVL